MPYSAGTREEREEREEREGRKEREEREEREGRRRKNREVARPTTHLRIRHRAGLEPAVEDLIDAAEHALALFAFDGEMVNRVAVEVGDGLDAGQFLELSDRLNDDDLLAIIAHCIYG